MGGKWPTLWQYKVKGQTCVKWTVTSSWLTQQSRVAFKLESQVFSESSCKMNSRMHTSFFLVGNHQTRRPTVLFVTTAGIFPYSECGCPSLGLCVQDWAEVTPDINPDMSRRRVGESWLGLFSSTDTLYLEPGSHPGTAFPVLHYPGDGFLVFLYPG